MKFGSKFLFTKIEASKQKILNLFQYFLQRAQAVSPFRYAKIAKKRVSLSATWLQIKRLCVGLNILVHAKTKDGQIGLGLFIA